VSSRDVDLVRGVVVGRGRDAPAPAGLTTRVGVSETTTGATGIGMDLVELAPRHASEPSLNVSFETAIYVLEGSLDVRHGPNLRHRTLVERGEFCFVAAQVPYELVNPSDTEPARALLARNTARERGDGLPHPPDIHGPRPRPGLRRGHMGHDVSPVERLMRAPAR
jgi:uncharacterized RmlC-like cupin family protein